MPHVQCCRGNCWLVAAISAVAEFPKYLKGSVFITKKVTRVFKIGARTLLGAPGIATRSKDATRGSWPYY